MLFKILKLFGIDVLAKFEAAKASLERRVEQVVKQVARDAALIAALAAIAAVAATVAVGIGLFALYRWAANAYGVYAGLEVTGGLMVAVALVCGVGAAIKVKSLGSTEASGSEGNELLTSAERTTTLSREPPIATVQPTTASASDIIEPFSLLLSKIVRYPTVGNPAVDRLIDNLRVTAQGAADETINSAAHVIRNGDRTNLMVVLTGAAFIGWLLSHHYHPRGADLTDQPARLSD